MLNIWNNLSNIQRVFVILFSIFLILYIYSIINRNNLLLIQKSKENFANKNNTFTMYYAIDGVRIVKK